MIQVDTCFGVQAVKLWMYAALLRAGGGLCCGRHILLHRWLPPVGQQLPDPTHGLRRQPRQHIGQVCQRIVPVEFRRRIRLMMAAARWPARNEPVNSQL